MDFKYWAGIIVGSGVVGAFVSTVVTHFLKQRADRERRNFDIRYSEYKKYLAALEEIASKGREAMESLMEMFFKQYIPRLLASCSDHEANQINIELSRDIGKLIDKTGFNFHQVNSELHGLRLVCGEKLSGLINEYTTLYQKGLEVAQFIFEEIKQGKESTAIEDEIKKDGERMQDLFDNIVVEMRKELKIK